MQMVELQNAFATRLAGSVKSPWDEIDFHYENVEIEGEPREVFSASLLYNGVKAEIIPPLEAIDILVDLKSQKPAGQNETWTWLEFAMDRSGKYSFNYKYSDPPLISDQLRHSK